MLLNFAIRDSIYEMLIEGSNREIGLQLSLHVVSPATSPNAPGWLYLILRGAFQDAEFESLQARPLSQ